VTGFAATLSSATLSESYQFLFSAYKMFNILYMRAHEALT